MTSEMELRDLWQRVAQSVSEAVFNLLWPNMQKRSPSNAMLCEKAADCIIRGTIAPILRERDEARAALAEAERRADWNAAVLHEAEASIAEAKEALRDMVAAYRDDCPDDEQPSMVRRARAVLDKGGT